MTTTISLLQVAVHPFRVDLEKTAHIFPRELLGFIMQVTTKRSPKELHRTHYRMQQKPTTQEVTGALVARVQGLNAHPDEWTDSSLYPR